MCATVGELKRVIADLPDDMVIGGTPCNHAADYREVSFYVHDRTQDEGWEEWSRRPEIVAWWHGNVPEVVFVCNTD
jgi:hypothetical protein